MEYTRWTYWTVRDSFIIDSFVHDWYKRERFAVEFFRVIQHQYFGQSNIFRIVMAQWLLLFWWLRYSGVVYADDVVSKVSAHMFLPKFIYNNSKTVCFSIDLSGKHSRGYSLIALSLDPNQLMGKFIASSSRTTFLNFRVIWSAK